MIDTQCRAYRKDGSNHAAEGTPIPDWRDLNSNHHNHGIQARASNPLEHPKGYELIEGVCQTSSQGECCEEDVGDNYGGLSTNSVAQASEDDGEACVKTLAVYVILLSLARFTYPYTREGTLGPPMSP